VGDKSLAGLTFTLVGPGRVGSSLAAWAVAAGASCQGTAGREEIEELASVGQDLLLLAVPDAALPEVAAQLALRPQARVILHTAGGLDASVLGPLQADSAVGSLHPLKAFPQPRPDPAEARGVFFAVDGDPLARELAHRLARAWGGVSADLPAASRPLYHLAASLAAGGVVTLLALAADLTARLGLPREVLQGLGGLAQGALAAALQAGEPALALTGPIVRGDRAAVERQLAALAHSAPEKIPLVMQLGSETLEQARRAGLRIPGHEPLARRLSGAES
jgi:predicted short-subunit dehydrogenase-like oxidoreductase (DUF2520 family)